MNNQILTEIEMNRKISLLQKTAEKYALNRTLENAMALARAKAELCKFAMQVVS